MQIKKNRFYDVIKWLIMITAYAYLVYKLANIEYWHELQSSLADLNASRIVYFLLFLILMPLNWALEIFIWQIICSDTIKLSFKEATKGILAGLNTGFVTPSRFGEFAGRIMFFPENKRMAGILLTFVNSFIMTLVITIFGLISAFFYTKQFNSNIHFTQYIVSIFITLVVFAAIYFLVPGISKKFKNNRWTAKVKNMTDSLRKLSIKSLLLAFILSAVRFAVFCFQYYLVLYFFRIQLTPVEFLVGVPTMYLLITYAPTLAASEAAVRGSFAVLILGVYSHNEIGILLTGILIWLINFIVPMLVGSVIVLKTKYPEKQQNPS